MTPDKWRRTEQIYHDALDRPADERDSFIEEASDRDEELHSKVKALLQSNEEASGFLDRPALDVAAHISTERQAESLVGRQINHYRTVRFLGAGGMGAVYEAQDTRLDRRVALKIMPSSTASDLDRTERFLREAKAASAVNHPNLVAIYDIGEDNNVSFIAMEYVEGKTLATRISEGSLKPAEVVDIAIQIADALDAAHAKGIMHRDIKPANLMLAPRGQVKVLDFGLAKITRRRVSSDAAALVTNSATATSMLMGTPQYASPEQLSGKKVDHRSDIFSLGAVLYEMATAWKRSSMAVADGSDQLHGQAVEITTGSAELDRIVRKCLEREPALRYTTRELLVDLKRLQQTLIQVPSHEVTNEIDDASSGGQGNHERKKAVSGIPTHIVGFVLQGLVLILLIGIAFSVLGGDRRVLRVEADDFDRLLNAYDLRHDVLTRNCYLQSFLIAIGICSLLLFRNHKLRIPGPERSFSADSLHFILAPVLLYLWAEFGFALDDLIKYRADAWQYLSLMGDPHSQPLSRRAMLFNDSGFMDGWFICFRPAEHAINTNFFIGAALFFALVFGTLFSLNHAYIVIGLQAAAQSFAVEAKRVRSAVTHLVGLFPWLALILLVVSHLQFRFGGNHPNWIQPVIGGGTLIFAWRLSQRRAAVERHVTHE